MFFGSTAHDKSSFVILTALALTNKDGYATSGPKGEFIPMPLAGSSGLVEEPREFDNDGTHHEIQQSEKWGDDKNNASDSNSKCESMCHSMMSDVVMISSLVIKQRYP